MASSLKPGLTDLGGRAKAVDPDVDFSLVDGDLTVRLQRAIGLIPPRGLGVGRRALLSVLITWVPLVIAAWLAEAPHWYRELGGLLLDADSGVGVGANLGDAIWWMLVVLVLWTMPIGVLGAAAGGVRARRRRDREHPEGGLAAG